MNGNDLRPRPIEIFGVLVAIAGVLVAIVGVFVQPKGFELSRVVTSLTHDRGLWFGPVLIGSLICLVGSALVMIWNRDLLITIRQIRQSNPRSYTKRLIGTYFVTLVSVLIMKVILSIGDVPDLDIMRLFPQGSEFGPMKVSTYGTNGVTQYSFDDSVEPNGPEEGTADIAFTTESSPDSGCGWVLTFIKGTDLSFYNEIRFLIRGERGNEDILMKAKDARGREAQLQIQENYLRGRPITTDWQEATIPLVHFSGVDWGRMDNISLASIGSASSAGAGALPISQRIRVGHFRFIRTNGSR